MFFRKTVVIAQKHNHGGPLAELFETRIGILVEQAKITHNAFRWGRFLFHVFVEVRAQVCDFYSFGEKLSAVHGCPLQGWA